MLSRKPYIVARFDKEITLNRKEAINFSYKESEISGDKERLSNRLWIKLDRSASEIVQYTKKYWSYVDLVKEI